MSKPNSKTVVYMDLIGFGEYAKQAGQSHQKCPAANTLAK